MFPSRLGHKGGSSKIWKVEGDISGFMTDSRCCQSINSLPGHEEDSGSAVALHSLDRPSFLRLLGQMWVFSSVTNSFRSVSASAGSETRTDGSHRVLGGL